MIKTLVLFKKNKNLTGKEVQNSLDDQICINVLLKEMKEKKS